MFNGPILGFDYAIYQPDGASYTFRTLSFLYENPSEAANRVSEWYVLNGFKHNIIAPFTLLPENSPVWHLVAPRILYPLLSLPFVAALGIPGMLVVPALSMLVLMVSTHLICLKYGLKWLGVFLAGFVRFSLMQFLGISLLLFLLNKKKLSILVAFFAFLPTLFVDFTPAVLVDSSDSTSSILQKCFSFLSL